MFKVFPHGKLSDPNDDDYYNINPMTYEGVFFQEQHDDVVRNKDDDDLGYDDWTQTTMTHGLMVIFHNFL